MLARQVLGNVNFGPSFPNGSLVQLPLIYRGRKKPSRANNSAGSPHEGGRESGPEPSLLTSGQEGSAWQPNGRGQQLAPLLP